MNLSVDEKSQMPLSQSGFYTNPLNHLDNEESKYIDERRAVTRDYTTNNKRSKRVLRPLNTDGHNMPNMLPLTNISQNLSSNANNKLNNI
jgi:hypothetical protein